MLITYEFESHLRKLKGNEKIKVNIWKTSLNYHKVNYNQKECLSQLVLQH